MTSNNMFAQNNISSEDFTVKSYERVGTVLKLMESLNVEHLVVVTGDLFIGLVSEEAILGLDDDLLLNEIDKLDLTYENAHLSDHLLDVYRKILDSGLSVLPVLNDKGKIYGAISRVELFEKIGETFGITEPGALIVLRMKKRDYSLSEISRIVESERNTVLLSLVSNEADGEFINCTLKLHSSDIQDVVSALTRYGYEISAVFTEESYHEFLTDRYDQFISYLNV